MSRILPDLVGLVGLILLGCGVGMYSVPCALVSVGGLLVLLSISMAKGARDVS